MRKPFFLFFLSAFSGRLFLRMSLLLGTLLSLSFGGFACTGTVLPYLRHFKKPIAAVFLDTEVQMCTGQPGQTGITFCKTTAECPSGQTCADQKRPFLYVANADMDRLLVVDVLTQTLLIVREKTHGIYSVRTGRYPVDLKVSPDKKRLYTLHGIDGDIRVFDTRTREPLRDQSQILRIPAGCQPQKTCWRSPHALVVFPTADKLFGYVSLPSDQAVALVDLHESNATFGQEIKKISVLGRPAGLILDETRKRLYVTDSSQESLSIIDLETQSLVQSFSIGVNAVSGSLSPDGQLLYLVNVREGGISVVDIAARKAIPQGDPLYPDRLDIHIPGVAFQSVHFLPVFSSFRNKNGSGFFAWATASDGYGYILDASKHRLYDSNTAAPTVESLSREVISEAATRTDLPTLAIEDIKVFDGTTRDETWLLTYEGKIIEARDGRFTDFSKGIFRDDGQNLFEQNVRPGDTFVLLRSMSIQECRCLLLERFGQEGETRCAYELQQTCQRSSCPLTGTPPANSQILECPTAFFPILQVEGKQLTLDLQGQTLGPPAEWRYSVRAAQSFLPQGTVSGILPERIKAGLPFLGRQFSVTIKPGVTNVRELRFTFRTTSGFAPTRIEMGGFLTHTAPAEDAACLLSQNCARLWALDTALSRIFALRIDQDLIITRDVLLE